ncbi:hypothetical protein SEA_GALADRIEL_76 [Gordonia phage Galadriel]|uniref:Uncharacterized protein n=1 Tax=Gordonia phage Galadriel TaxID=2591208 RepID=A0A514DEQ5_9CAUD|nr:hypothetical protein KNU61_gp76 [Gordonia phage Galadriel]QDH92095.1 hypothetical protein SEA_GALADRIEL_76 [Gordonia phage Galadriel]
MSRFEIPLRPPAPSKRGSAHDPSAKIVVEHDPGTTELTVWPIGCATPMRDFDDFDRFVDALLWARSRIRSERLAADPRAAGGPIWTHAECKQGCGTQVRVPAGFERHAECARCAGLESEVHGG